MANPRWEQIFAVGFCSVCLLRRCYMFFPPLACAEAFALLVVVILIYGGGINLRREPHYALAMALFVFLLGACYDGAPSLVGDTFFGMDSGTKRFNNGTSAYPVSIFEKRFPPFEANVSDCRYVRVAGAREQWQSNGLYVKTGELNGRNQYECSNCYLYQFPLLFPRHLSFDRTGVYRRWFLTGLDRFEPSDVMLRSGCRDLFNCSMHLNCPLEAFQDRKIKCTPARWAEYGENGWDQNSNITVECVDEELCGPGYRNATRRAWTWLSWQGSRPLLNLWGAEYSAYCFIWTLSVSGLILAFWWGVIEPVFEARHEIRRRANVIYGRLRNVREVSRLRKRLRKALSAERRQRARADRLAVELATLRGMNHMCTALANRVGAYNS